MALTIGDFWVEAILLSTILVATVFNYFHNSYKYWLKKNVPTLQPRFPLGNSNTLFTRGLSVGIISKKFYDELKKNRHKFGGVYLVTTPNLVIVDPEYIRDIICKDFQHFVDRGVYYNEKKDPLSAHLFSVDSPKWRILRTKLTPTFTSGKMKMMFGTVMECCDNMIEAIDKNLGKDIEIKEVLGCFTTDVIGSCAFGVNCNSFKHPDAEFRRMGKKHFEYHFFKAINGFFLVNLPKLSLRLGLTNNRKVIRDFFTKVVEETVTMRQKNQIRRNDFLQILMDLKEESDFTLEEMAAQVFVFFIAGFETSSTAMTFALYELARNQDLQEKLRQEVCQVLKKYDNTITYESLGEMKLLGQVFDETLRMYPPLTTLNRRCTKDYTLRDTNIVIEKGTPVLISTLGLHMDPEYYPEPEKFDPERFSDENKRNRRAYVYLPFGDGPRNCIGLRFGMMQSKIGIASIVKNFKLTVSPASKPVEFDPHTFLLNTTNQIYLKVEKI